MLTSRNLFVYDLLKYLYTHVYIKRRVYYFNFYVHVCIIYVVRLKYIFLPLRVLPFSEFTAIVENCKNRPNFVHITSNFR